MRNIIETMIEETKQEFEQYGLYSHEEYAGRIGALKELLAILNKEDDEAMIGIMLNQKEEQEMIDARQAEEAQCEPLWSSKDGNIERQFLEAELDDAAEDEMFEGSQNVKRLQSDLRYMANL
jgi:hypothetical protein